jgi:hypothetical protein
MMTSVSILASNFSLLAILLIDHKSPDFSFSWNIFDGSRIISVVMTDFFVSRNRDSGRVVEQATVPWQNITED